MRIGVVGLGAMGSAIARRLQESFGPILVFNRTAGKTGPLVSAGAVAAGDIGDLRECDFIVSMLFDDAAVADVFLGPHGLASQLQRGAIHIAMSTVSADLTARLDAAHAGAGSVLVAAPVLGRPERAELGQLFVMAAGPEEAVRRCEPLLQRIGQKTFRVGDAPQTASVAKIAMNFMVSTVVENLAECFALARKCGLDTEALLELVTQTIFAAPVYHSYAPLIARQVVPEKGSTIRISLKDVELALSLGQSFGAGLPIAELLQSRLRDAIASGYGDRDCTSLALLADATKPGEARRG